MAHCRGGGRRGVRSGTRQVDPVDNGGGINKAGVDPLLYSFLITLL